MSTPPRPAAPVALELGVGRADITALESIGLFGFGSLTQVARGFYQRLWARAFMVRQGGSRVCWVVCDLGFVDPALRRSVLHRLAEAAPERFGPTSDFGADGLLISATHTHAAPGGYSAFVMYNLSIKGHSRRVLETVTEGIVQAVLEADASLRPGSLRLVRGAVREVGINRSLEAHRANPVEDQAPEGLDEGLSQLQLVDADGSLRASCSWYAAHPTNLVGSNRFIAGDNRGYASWALEQEGIVAAFPLAPCGDVSPNRVLTDAELLTGEGDDLRESTAIIGERLAAGARRLQGQRGERISGTVGAAFAEVHLPGLRVAAEHTTTGRPETLAPGVLGQAFASGTKDGRGPAWYAEGDASKLISLVAGLAGYADHPGQRPKPAFLPVTRREMLLDLPLQVISLGDLLIAAVPLECTVAAGKRLRRRLAARHGLPEHRVLITTHANGYAGYQATPEEYDHQRYEGGFTLFGREQLSGIVQELCALDPTRPAPQPLPELLALALPCLDRSEAAPKVPPGCWFGDVVEQAPGHARAGQVLAATFWSVPPRGGRRLVEVERLVDGGWELVHDDHDWATWVEWRSARGGTQVRCCWEVPAATAPGTYRIVHRGRVGQPFHGASRPIHVLAAAEPWRPADRIFDGLTPAAHATAAGLLPVVELQPGEALITRGATDTDLYLVLEGRFSSCIGEVEVARCGAGSVLGELAMFGSEPRAATVVSLEAGRVLRVSRAAWQELSRLRHPVIARLEREVLEVLAERLRRTDFVLDQLLHRERVGSRLARDLASSFGGVWSWSRRPLPAPAEALGRIDIFADAPAEALEALAPALETLRVPRGTELCVQDEPGAGLYLLVEGTVRVSVGLGSASGPRWLADLGPGAAFGLTSLVDGRACGATCTAAGEVVVLALPRERWAELAGADSVAGATLRRAAIRAFVGQLLGCAAHLGQLRDGARDELRRWLAESAALEATRPEERRSA